MNGLYRRGHWEGVTNIIWFNWHFYVLAFGVAVIGFLLISLSSVPALFKTIIGAGVGIAVFYLLISLLISHYIYDCSDLYRMSWLTRLQLPGKGRFVNVHSGFDETSLLLKSHFPKADWIVLDFYDPKVHTEISIARARAYKPALPENQSIQSASWPLKEGSVTAIFGILAIHEIRNQDEKVAFFAEAYRVLDEEGKFILVEHLRDSANFLAYGPGFLHFFSERTWNDAFAKAGFFPENRFHITPFVRVLILTKSNR
jgi:SAM-dependent methyltransferase